METTDNTDGAAGDDSLADTGLHRALRSIADGVQPLRDPLTGVLGEARRMRRRRRASRAAGAMAVLVAGVGLGPPLVDRIEDRHVPDAVIAAPPAAVVELPGAYPIVVTPTAEAAPQAAALPPNALGWPARGATAPVAVLEAAKSYLVAYARKTGGAVAGQSATGPATAEVHQLWAHQEQPGKPVWQFVGEGWTSGAGVTSQAYLVDVEWDGSRSGARAETVSAAAFPTRFTHPEPGSAPDPMAVDRISEISFAMPSGRMLVIGAPQVKTVLYSASGGKDFTVQKTVDGVALFPRTGKQSHGKYADEVQVRDANNAALTPPGGWPAGDYDPATAAKYAATDTPQPTYMPNPVSTMAVPSPTDAKDAAGATSPVSPNSPASPNSPNAR